MKLTNKDISDNYRDMKFCLLPSDFSSAFACWVVRQNPNKVLIDINPSLRAFDEYIGENFPDKEIPEFFSYARLKEIVSEEMLEAIPDILALNELKPDFIDLCALARNASFMIMRESIMNS